MQDTHIFEAAKAAWAGAADFRSRRTRYKNYTYGDQWCDIVADTDGNPCREEDLLRRSGKRPYVNNLIRQLVKTIVGRYRTISAETALYSGKNKAIAQANCLSELDSRLLEEFLISGCAVQKIVSERRFNGTGVWIDNVDPRMFFVNPYKDPRGWDIELIGMIHEMTVAELINRFAGGDRTKATRLRRIYDVENGNAHSGFAASSGALGRADLSESFLSGGHPDKCRVAEVWTFDAVEPEDGESADSGAYRLGFKWRCRFFAPDGSVLDSFDSPFAHGSHPFAIKLYPLTDGEIHSFVEDVIDQQRYINRLIVMIDHIMASSAKGVLLFPEDQLPKGVDWKDVQLCWAMADGVIPITGRSNVLPQQIVTSGANSGAYQLLSLQMKLLENISGVGDALMGRSTSGSTGAELYDNQIRNATIALSDIFETFTSFISERDRKASAVKS